ncbi:hypothetical protein NOF04DRAFT_7436 [Fusarium oxysporum II5]|uniref:Uncharacterized protein n=1 Tax=Fusarium odoratissimum (strain NRRL 54006) TaxID=1089451 RepID=X0JMB7_FUSO5|nr:uncharacterized protein FOIG_10503 [Fusarium odoratissimum NRRL 54006]XP_031059556.1 uncharacterized protein FOIG_10503 [Fusarium odoratissimum NRRL 54006]EXL97465.1 hypothetical protein FOIG_10503 [Fusarium odoratissimum NRRL 54006]EXL97466.1 hypothetical protein FOIG_10503 [Fusarium odoratissimum NRRL 54006]KAK2123478.1 hypothetical protein NOF04DRAFT_7436 [Fusarium oxysporum II5]
MQGDDDHELATVYSNSTRVGSSVPLVDDPGLAAAIPSPGPEAPQVDQLNVKKSRKRRNFLLSISGMWRSRHLAFFRNLCTRKSKRMSALRHFSIMHLPPVTITLALLSLYIAKVNWKEPSNEGLNALQFAAKSHETVLLLSLGDILLYRISYGLDRQDIGVPLGFLPSSFYLAAPFRYLASRQLWAPTFKSSKNTKHQWATGAMIVSVSILCIAASPLSAIAMIPRLGWWKNDDFDAFADDGGSPLAKWLPHIEYRTVLGSESIPLPGVQSLVDPIKAFLRAGVDVDLHTNFEEMEFSNISYSNYDEGPQSVSLAQENEITYATCPLSIVATLLRVAVNRGAQAFPGPWLTTCKQQIQGHGDGTAWKQPLLAVKCQYGLTDSHFFNFSSVLLNETLTLDGDKDLAGVDLHNLTRGDHRFLNLRANKNWPVSADILFGSSENKFTLCLVFARWSAADTWIELPRSFQTWSNFEEPIVQSISNRSSDFIHLEDKWMDGIATFSHKSFFDSMAEICEAAPSFVPRCYEHALALHITDGLAQTGNVFLSPGYKPQTEQSNDSTKQEDAILFIRYYYTYAYRFESSRGIPLAFTFLLLHVLMVLIHLVKIIQSKDPWQGSDWDNFGDMLVLALASKPPDGTNDLAQQSSKSELWRKTVTIGCDGDEGYFQIRLREQKGYQRTRQQEEESGGDFS